MTAGDAQEDNAVAPPIPHPATTDLKPLPVPPLDETCLLYTSDAADE